MEESKAEEKWAAAMVVARADAMAVATVASVEAVAKMAASSWMKAAAKAKT